MGDITTPMIQQLERFLNVTSARHTLVTTNMANIDTPGYRTKDLDFRAELQKADGFGEANFQPVVRNVPGLLERPDGNDVNLDRESLLMAETQMQFRLGIQLVKHEFQQLLAAINEGKQG